MNCEHAEKPVPFFWRSGGIKPTGHVEIIPADGAVLDEPVAAFSADRLPEAMPDPAPGHSARGKELAPKLLHFHLPELWEIHLPVTPGELVNVQWAKVRQEG